MDLVKSHLVAFGKKREDPERYGIALRKWGTYKGTLANFSLSSRISYRYEVHTPEDFGMFRTFSTDDLRTFYTVISRAGEPYDEDHILEAYLRAKRVQPLT